MPDNHRINSEMLPVSAVAKPKIINGTDEQCRTCGDWYSPYGDGYDGECPHCADLTAIEAGECEA